MTESKDVFFCYAHEDKKAVVQPLAKALKNRGFTYWLDENEIRWGDPVPEKISQGMSSSRLAIVVISSNSIDKPWPTAELNAALGRHISSAAVRVLPLLVGGDDIRKRFREKWSLIAENLYMKWEGKPAAIVKALRSHLEPVASAAGIVSREDIRLTKTKLQGEVFVIELLKQPVELERGDSGVTITVDRRNVAECVINNEGKRKLIADHADVIRTLGAEDSKIQRFLTEEIAGKMTVTQDGQVPLRWASGGVLSLVRFKRRKWVPLFFRDIPPYGWNISLGSTERRFDLQGQALSDGEMEHRHPWDFILREFLEESIVINRRPDLDDPLNPTAFRAFTADFSLPGLNTQRWKEYADFRRKCDNLSSGFDGKPIRLRPVRLKKQITLKILSNPVADKPSDPDKEDNILVCFSLTDLGIEIVKVFKYDLQDSDYLLDGEIDHEGCLVRMPMALFSRDYLAEIFSHNENWNHYDTPFGEPPSIKVTRAPTESEVVPFLWDVEQRMNIINGKMEGTDHERKRFKDWRDMFGDNFLDRDDRPSLANTSRLFVPGTAKILNRYFSMLQGAQHG